MHNLIHVSTWIEATALYGGAFCIGAMFCGIVFGLDHLANKHGLNE